jgi:hypothetical protein
MSDSNPLPRYARELLNRYKQLQVLTLASVQVARDRAEELSEALEEKDDDAVPVVNLERRHKRVSEWMSRAYQLLTWLDRKSHEVGVIVETVQMGVIEPGQEGLRQMTQLMFEKHKQVAVRALEHLGRGNYNEALELGDKLLVDESDEEDAEKFETTPEFDELRETLNPDEVDEIVGSSAEESPSTTRIEDPTTDDDDEDERRSV